MDQASGREKSNAFAAIREFTHLQRHEYQPKRFFFFKVLVVALVVFFWLTSTLYDAFDFLGNQNTSKSDEYSQDDFDTITPSEKLVWYPCRNTFLCARLTVPMDYHRPLNASPQHPKVHIALLLAPGKHEKPGTFSASPLLVNPGGPGGSGTLFAELAAKSLQDIIGSGQDVIGFDPRGIGATTPRLDCFSYPSSSPNSSFDGDDYVAGFSSRYAWEAMGQGIGLVNSSNVALSKLDVRARAAAKLCQSKDAMNGQDSIFRHVHTPSVARDMLSIVDAWDEWTASLPNQNGETNSNTMNTQESDDSVYSLDTKGKLVYWGFSYGTLLGATFASMFPDRVGRVMLDGVFSRDTLFAMMQGVVDADHYVEPIWADSIRDADKILDSFSRYCHKAKHNCALWREGDSIADIQERFDGVLSNLKENPLTTIDKYSNRPIVVYADDLKRLIFGVLYAPIMGFPVIALLFNEIYLGIDERYTLLKQVFQIISPMDWCGTKVQPWYYPNDAQLGIMCSDKRYPLNETVPNLLERFEKMSEKYSFADVWIGLMAGCDGWGIKPVDPPMKWDPLHKLKPINTSFPLLFLSNKVDPVTPLHAAIKMTRKFVNAGLVEQNALGHCTLSAASKCTTGKIREYIHHGKVPPHPKVNGEWDICEADQYPFGPYPPPSTEDHSTVGQMEVKSMNAMKDLQTIFTKFQFTGLNPGFGLPNIDYTKV